MENQLRVNDRFGSQAAREAHSNPKAGSGTNPVVQTTNFEIPELNDCIPRQRSFTPLNISEIDRRLTAYSVEKLYFEIDDDFICDLSVISYSRYEGVAEVA